MLYTTFRLLREHGACTDRYRHLAKELGGVKRYGFDTPISIERILDTNGLDDALWALQAAIEPADRFNRLLACDYAEHVLYIYESQHPDDKRLRQVIEVSRRYVMGLATEEELATARDAAWAAVCDAARDARAAWSAWAAVWAAARDAAWAAWAAARAAARAAERQWQEQRLREKLRQQVMV